MNLTGTPPSLATSQCLDSPEASHGEGLVWFDAVHEVLNCIKELLAFTEFETLVSLLYITYHCKEVCVRVCVCVWLVNMYLLVLNPITKWAKVM